MDEKKELFVNEKRMIGILIAHYFEESDIKQTDFLDTKIPAIQQSCVNCNKSCKHQDGICSYKTFIKMKYGKSILRDCQYEDMAHKLNLKYKINQELLKTLNNISIELEKCMDSGVEREYLECLAVIEKEYKICKENIYFKDILQMFQSLINFQLYQTLPYEEHIKRLEKIVEYLEEPIKYQAYYLIYRYYSSTYQDKSDELLEEISKLYPDKILFKLLLLREKLPLLEYYKYINTLEVSTFKRQDQYFVYNSRAFVAFNLDNYQEVVLNLMECMKIASKKNNEMTEKKILNLYTQYAMTQYELENYTESSEYYLKVYRSIPDLLVLNFILFIHSLEILGKKDEIKNLLNLYDEDELENKIVKIIYRYYKKKYVYEDKIKELQRYIVEDMAPILYEKSTFYEVIRGDLVEYCEKNRSYKLLVDFEKNIKK